MNQKKVFTVYNHDTFTKCTYREVSKDGEWMMDVLHHEEPKYVFWFPKFSSNEMLLKVAIAVSDRDSEDIIIEPLPIQSNSMCVLTGSDHKIFAVGVEIPE